MCDMGGFIAGGFARQCFLGRLKTHEDLRDYFMYGVFSSEREMSLGNKRAWACLSSDRWIPGDMDIFFNPPEDQADLAFDDRDGLYARLAELGITVSSGNVRVSFARLALNVSMQALVPSMRYLDDKLLHGGNAQLITHPQLRGDPKRVTDGFDIVNAKCVIVWDPSIKRHVIKHDPRVPDLESAGQLLVQRVNSPMLIRRCLKYLIHRGLTSMHVDSLPFIYDWVLMHATNTPMGSPMDDLMKKHDMRLTENLLTEAHAKGVITGDMLAMLLDLHVVKVAVRDSDYNLIRIDTRDVAADLIRAST